MKKQITKTKAVQNKTVLKKEPVSTKVNSGHHFSSNHHPNDDLYICINDVTTKRKYLLQSLKSSLVLQEEHEKAVDIRARKLQVLNDIKKEMESINSKYQNLKKLLPNVKNVISFTEKELNELDREVEVLKQDVKIKSREIEIDEKTAQDLAVGMKLSKTKKVVNVNQQKPILKEEVMEVPKKKLTKLDRIQNNLKLIESKLKNI